MRRVAESLRRAVCGWFAFAVIALGACSVDRRANECTKQTTERDCTPGQECYRGYCIDKDADTSGDAGADPGRQDAAPPGSDEDAGGDGGMEPPPLEPCEKVADEKPCYSGTAGTLNEGKCRAGKSTCAESEEQSGLFWGPCVDEIVPGEELCNGEDDDCNGVADDDVGMATCNTQMSGKCAAGVLFCDVMAGSAVCIAFEAPTVEVCDGEDNDCDGETDEGSIAATSCYPGGAPGCTDADGNGVFECLGICRSGTQICTGAMVQDCQGHVLPAAAEDCNVPPGTAAADDDCDGTTDEGCTCSNGLMRTCYGGPLHTRGKGECTDGQQMCTNNAWGDCVGEVLPAAETCGNLGADNDCDEATGNDVPMEGDPCDAPGRMGRCHSGTRQCQGVALVCVTPEPRTETCDSSDDDCDGNTDEGFNLQTDEANCGQCRMTCEAGETCCNGGCVNTATSETYCGSCTNPCGSGVTCCGGQCFNLQSDNGHCGACSGSSAVCGLGFGCCRGQCTLLTLGC